MKELYGKASIFVLASWFENMNMTLLEAMQAGCKIIASNVGGNPEVVDKDSVFESQNISELKSLILKKKEEENKIEEFKFNLTDVVAKFKKLYE